MRRSFWQSAVVVMIAVVLMAGCHKKRKHRSGGNNTEAELTLQSPNGGETWSMGRAQTVVWTACDPASVVDIEYTTDGSTWNPLSMGRVNDGHAPVTVPTTPSTTARVRVTERASGDFDISDEDFSFAGIVVTSPNGGETWIADGSATVTWVSGGIAGTVDIEYALDGATWLPLVTGTSNDGSETITVPSTTSTTVKVRVSEAGGVVTDMSDDSFTIAGLVVTSPNGGEVWKTSLPATVTWMSAFAGTMDIELTTDGVVWVPLVLATPNDGSEILTVPSTPSTTARIRVSQTAGSRSDISDGVFVIQRLFETLSAGLANVSTCALAWGDYDNDGDLDLALAGWTGSAAVSRIYRNDGGGVFVDIGAGLTGAEDCSLAWGDYDRDGDLDLAIAGWSGAYASRIYQNAGGGVFTDIGAGLVGVSLGSLAWGDYDNDGDLDLALTGWNGSYISRIYRNAGGGVFTDIGAALAGVRYSSLAWGDYDNDGDLDLALAGYNGSGLSRIYQNAGGGVFIGFSTGLADVYGCQLAWGDYDNDGDLDLALAGDTGAVRSSAIYQNTGGGVFTNIGAGLTGVSNASLAWGDYDNDGDLDLALTGHTGSAPVSLIYRNAGGGVFTDSGAGLTGVFIGSLAWGDYDNDGDLDLALAGSAGIGSVSQVYRNNLGTPNAGPSAPAGLIATPGAGSVTFSWTAPADDHTPASGLNYNLRIGTTSGGSNTYSSMANSSTGYRRIPWLGLRQTTSATLALPSGTYYWSVQAVDSAFRGGAWAAEGSFVIP